MSGRLSIAISLSVALIMAVSCGQDDSGKVIPPSKMEKIYREMFLADRWVQLGDGRRNMVDTSWLYRPIFEKYGFTHNDYLKTVESYLNDPERFSDLIGRVAEGLEKDADNYRRAFENEQRLIHRKDSIAALLNSIGRDGCPLFEELFMTPSVTDRIDISLNEDGVFYPVPVLEDTMYSGPAMVFADSIRAHQDTTKVRPVFRMQGLILNESDSSSVENVDAPVPEAVSVEEHPAKPVIGPEGITIDDDQPLFPDNRQIRKSKLKKKGGRKND